MDTVTLQFILDHGTWLHHLQGRVCSRDLLPKTKPSNVRAYIINTDSSNQPGEHWIGLYYYENSKEAYYFDSYGLPPYHEEILEFLKKTSNKWTFNNQQVQDWFSETCGLYCVFTLDALAKGYDIQQYLQHHFYKTNYFKNDVKVRTWFEQNYGTLNDVSKRQSVTFRGQCCSPKQNHHELNKHYPHFKLLSNSSL